MREHQFDGLVGPTHNYGGLSRGNVASTSHGGEASNPRAAAREGLEKMRFVRDLGVSQAVLPPQERPSLSALRRLGFRGSDEQVIAAAASTEGGLPLRLCSSASAMWAANAATVAPSSDTEDGRVHLTPANLQHMFHRAIEAPTTTRVLRAIFADPARFAVHDALPGGGQLADEGAANHTRLVSSKGAVHVFAWGRRTWAPAQGPRHHPARQTLEASQALARLHQLAPDRCLFPQQHPHGIDAGAFHTDVLAVGHGALLLFHELAFLDEGALLDRLRLLLGEELSAVRASSQELPPESAVGAYPFNSQLVTRPDGAIVVVAPEDSREDVHARAFLERAVSEGHVAAVHYVDVRQSMRNGGGPACLRLRVPLMEEEVAGLGARVLLDEALFSELNVWVTRHYRDRLTPSDLADAALARESMRALDELTQILQVGSVYDFQRSV
jgi:succinylarginine dihydrolase